MHPPGAARCPGAWRLPPARPACPSTGLSPWAACRVATLLAWWLALLPADLWVTFVLGQFADTRPWAERSTQWLPGLLQQLALGVAGAVPGLLSAALIFFIARQLAQGLSHILQRVERGTVQMSWLDHDTAGPTRSCPRPTATPSRACRCWPG
jgi:hypothetical protein